MAHPVIDRWAALVGLGNPLAADVADEPPFGLGSAHRDHPLNRPLMVRKPGKKGLYAMGRREFESRLRPPEGRRIPGYPTGPCDSN